MRLALSPLTLAIRTAFNGPTLDLNFDGRPLDPRITFTRASAATRVNQQGLIETVGPSVPRIDYDPVTLAPRGLLVEEQRTNLVLWSNDFTNAAWGKSNCTVSAAAGLAPDGSLTACKLIEDGSNATHEIFRNQGGLTASTNYTVSWVVKAAERGFVKLAVGASSGVTVPDTTVSLSTGAITGGSGSIFSVNLGNGWWRFWAVANTGAGTNLVLYLAVNSTGSAGSVYQGNGTSGVLVWHSQVEAGAFPTSPIPTTTAQATRAADNAVMTGTNFSSWFNAAQGTILVEGSALAAGVGNQIYAGVGLSSTNGLHIRQRSTPDVIAMARWNGSLYDAAPASVVLGQARKFAASYLRSGLVTLCGGGGPVVTGSPALPADYLTGSATASIGSYVDGSGQLNGHIRRLSFYPRAMSASELQALTA